MKKKSKRGIFGKLTKLGILVAYFVCVAVLVVQGLTPGKESANISNNVGNILNEIVPVHKVEKKEVTAVKTTGYILNGKEFGASNVINAYAGDTGTIYFTVEPSDANNKSINYSSTNESVVTIEADGSFTALAVGQSTIKATSAEKENISASITVNVNPINAENVHITTEANTLRVEQELLIDYVINPINATDKSVIWETNNENVITVTNGLVKAIGEGTAIVTVKLASDTSISDSLEISVLKKEEPPVYAEKVEISYANPEDIGKTHFLAKESVQLAATVFPSNATNKNVTWSSSKTSIATVKNGLVTFKKGGTVIITAKSVDGKASTTITFTVNDILPSAITLTSKDLTLTNKGNGTYTATMPVYSFRTFSYTPTGTTTATATIKSSNTSVATVSGGNITALSEGVTNITVTYTDAGDKTKSVSAKLTLTVTKNDEHIPPTAIAVDKYTLKDVEYPVTNNTIEIYVDEEIKLGAIISPANATVSGFTQKANNNVVSISNGVIKGLKPGEAIITLTVSDAFASKNLPSCQVTIKVKKIDVTNVTINQLPEEIVEGETLTLSATITPSKATEKGVTWSSSDENVLIITDNEVKAVGIGTATITATSVDNPSIFDTITITVKAKTIVLEDITLFVDENQVDNIKLYRGETANVTVLYTPENATFTGLNYESDNTTVATVKNGVITTKNAGIATIKVKSNTYNIEKTITVTVKEIVSKTITITPSSGITKDNEDNLCIKVGTSSKIKVKLDKNATIRTCTFSSSNESVATIGSDGYIEGISPGKTTITITTTDAGKSPDGESVSTIISFELTVTALSLKDTVKNFSLWIRKSFGHFGAFLVLGIFAALSFILFTPKSLLAKITACIACLVSGFAVAGITEICQLPNFTTGRACSFKDVMLDFRGYAYSTIAIFAIIILVYVVKIIVQYIKTKQKNKA